MKAIFPGMRRPTRSDVVSTRGFLRTISGQGPSLEAEGNNLNDVEFRRSAGWTISQIDRLWSQPADAPMVRRFGNVLMGRRNAVAPPPTIGVSRISSKKPIRMIWRAKRECRAG